MDKVKTDQAINIKYILITLLAVIFSWILHEFTHWEIGELLGNDMAMTLNTCYPKSGKYIEDWHEPLISIVGPIVTLLQAILFWVLMKRSPNRLLFPFLLTCFYMRSLAGALNFINLNDEGRVSKFLGLGTFTLPILVIGILFYLTYDISKTRGFKIKFIVLTALLIMLFSSILILADQILKVKII